mgnify:CR=1 FL=1
MSNWLTRTFFPSFHLVNETSTLPEQIRCASIGNILFMWDNNFNKWLEEKEEIWRGIKNLVETFLDRFAIFPQCWSWDATDRERDRAPSTLSRARRPPFDPNSSRRPRTRPPKRPHCSPLSCWVSLRAHALWMRWSRQYDICLEIRSPTTTN